MRSPRLKPANHVWVRLETTIPFPREFAEETRQLWIKDHGYKLPRYRVALEREQRWGDRWCVVAYERIEKGDL